MHAPCPLSYLLSSVRLRDMTQETDQEQRRRIGDMEKDVANFEDLQGTIYLINISRGIKIWTVSFDETLIKLANAEQQVEDLKLQLDDALSAEDMVVRLTERNLFLGEVYCHQLTCNCHTAKP